MLFGSLCMSAFQALIAFISGDSSSGVSNTNDDNGVFLTDKNSRIVFEKPPEYFTKHNSHNRRLISCESMQEAIESVISRFNLDFLSEKDKEQCKQVVEYLHNALYEEGMSNVDVINILSIIANNHNIFTHIQVNPEDKTQEEIARGLTKIYLPYHFKELDNIAKKPDYYIKDNYQLDRLTRKSILHEVKLYEKIFSANYYYEYTAHSIWNYGSNESKHIDPEFGGVSEEVMRDIPEDHVSRLIRLYSLHRMFCEEIVRLHKKERESDDDLVIFERDCRDDGVFLADRNSRIVFEKPPKYFTKHDSRNRRLISCESMQEAVKSVISRFKLDFPSKKDREQCEEVVKHLHNAFHKEGMTNVDAINILSIIANNHNIFTHIQVNPKNKTRGKVVRGFTQIHSHWFQQLDDVAGKIGYYIKDQYQLDRLTEESILHEVKLYEKYFLKDTIYGLYTDSIAHIIRGNDSNLSKYIDTVFGGVREEVMRKISKNNHVSRLIRLYCLHRMFGEEIVRFHEKERKAS